MNALLEYGTSSDSEEDSDEKYGIWAQWAFAMHCNNVFKTIISFWNFRTNIESAKPKLPKPTLGESTLQTSVFSNPFVEAEMAKAAILEKHVKMVYVDLLSVKFKLIVGICNKNNVLVVLGIHRFYREIQYYKESSFC